MANGLSGIGISGAAATGNEVTGNLIGIDVDGNAAPNRGNGVIISGGASGNTIGGDENNGNVISGNNLNGVAITGQGTDDNEVEGNYIGTDLDGAASVPNGRYGVSIFLGASSNTIGGADLPAQDNLISGNMAGGVELTDDGTSDNTIQGNLIGTDLSGADPLGNRVVGILIHGGASDNQIGGSAFGEGNTVSGNLGDGIVVSGQGTTGNKIEGNLVGTDANGVYAVPNTGNGVHLTLGCTENDLGGSEPGAGNTISGNALDGVLVDSAGTSQDSIEGNLIGVDDQLDRVAAYAIPNGANGVEVAGGATGDEVGGAEAGAGNVISGNVGNGVYIHDAGTTNDNVEGNYIGTDGSGTAAIPNASGVVVALGASGIDVGGTEPGSGNVVSGNAAHGVVFTDAGTLNNMVEGDYIGTNKDGAAAVPNGGYGVLILNGASASSVGGGTDSRSANLISGNGAWGVGILGGGTTGNGVEGNRIGTNSTGDGALGNGMGGVEIASGASGNTVGGESAFSSNVISGNHGDGVAIHGSGTSGNVVEGDEIGVNYSAALALGNDANGVEIYDGASGNTVGGTEPIDINFIDNNGAASSAATDAPLRTNGVAIHDGGTTGNLVEGNDIGLSRSNLLFFGNFGNGVLIYGGAADNTVGGTTPGARNVISGNNLSGVTIAQQGTSGNTVAGNYIGVGNDGTTPLGNTNDGVYIQDDASGNTVGGTAAAGNVIAYNGVDGPGDGNGVAVGRPGAGSQEQGDAILGNSIFGNKGLGIDLGSDGVTANGVGPRSGPNHFQPYPTLTSAIVDGTSLTVTGTLVGAPGTSYRVEFYGNPAADPSGYGEGQTFLGFATVVTEADGTASFSAILPAPPPADQVITATATDPDNDTSEFSADFALSSAATSLLADGGFESPALGAGQNVYGPTGSPWTFDQGSAGGSGIAANGSAFVAANPAAPEGTQVGFLQGYGAISQAVDFAAGGSYQVSFLAAQRSFYGTNAEDFEVLVDGAVVATFQPAGTSYQAYATPAFAVAAGTHVITFQGLDTAGGDNTAFLDAVSLSASTTAPAVAPATWRLADAGRSSPAGGVPGPRPGLDRLTARAIDELLTGGTPGGVPWYFDDRGESGGAGLVGPGVVLDYVDDIASERGAPDLPPAPRDRDKHRMA